ncbi:MAG: type II toxin-antitoxin system prevent-host-death family antitoxin [Sulfurisoma sp.]|nr:type II toxin-antitoxin system prevent-host-death family antitoxin [Sulfurisoma sp.]
MQSVPIYQLKNELSKFIQRVEAGEEISVTRRGTVVARLVPSDKGREPGYAERIRAARQRFEHVEPFDERELREAGRKW